MVHRVLSIGLVLFPLGLLLGLGSCSNEPAPGEREDILGAAKPLYSQGSEEIAIRDFFQDRRGGVFLDVGCAHFQEHSTTYYLEKHLDWTGVAIDALDGYRADYEKNRPATRFFSYIITDHSGTVESFYKLGQFDLMSTADKDWAERFGKGDYEVIQIPTMTLTELLDREGVKKIDFLSMDIEGFEPPALAGLDIDRFRPEFVCIEAHPPTRKPILEYFKKHGYVLMVHYSQLDNGLNWYFRRMKQGEGEQQG